MRMIFVQQWMKSSNCILLFFPPYRFITADNTFLLNLYPNRIEEFNTCNHIEDEGTYLMQKREVYIRNVQLT